MDPAAVTAAQAQLDPVTLNVMSSRILDGEMIVVEGDAVWEITERDTTPIDAIGFVVRGENPEYKTILGLQYFDFTKTFNNTGESLLLPMVSVATKSWEDATQ